VYIYFYCGLRIENIGLKVFFPTNSQVRHTQREQLQEKRTTQLCCSTPMSTTTPPCIDTKQNAANKAPSKAKERDKIGPSLCRYTHDTPRVAVVLLIQVVLPRHAKKSLFPHCNRDKEHSPSPYRKSCDKHGQQIKILG
jgi:hypothetical protein